MKLFNGDWKKIAQLIEDNSIDSVITDPPWGCDFSNEIYDDNRKIIENEVLIWLKLIFRKLKNNSHCFIYVGVKTLNLWIDSGIKAGFEYKNILAAKIYDGYNYAGANNFKFNFQPIIYFSKGNPKHFNRVNFFPTSKSWFNDKRNKNPQKYSYSYSSFIDKEVCFSNVKTNKILKHIHNSEKNVKLLQFLIEISTKPGENVLDPFMGSGTTGLACKKTNRNFIGIELNEQIFETVKEMLQNSKKENNKS